MISANAFVGFQADPFKMNSEAAEAIVGASVPKTEANSSAGGKAGLISSIGPIEADVPIDPVGPVDWSRLDPASRREVDRTERYFPEEPNLKANDIPALALHFRGYDVLYTYVCSGPPSPLYGRVSGGDSYVNIGKEKGVFDIAKRTHVQQFSQMYFVRLAALAPALRASAQKKWTSSKGNTLHYH